LFGRADGAERGLGDGKRVMYFYFTCKLHGMREAGGGVGRCRRCRKVSGWADGQRPRGRLRRMHCENEKAVS
jgi:hypothetical protein